MTLGEFRELTKDSPDSLELTIYIPYESVLTASGRGRPETGAIVKDVMHVTTGLAEDMLIITTETTTKKVFVQSNKEKHNEMFCND